jgi:diamine N-acetyltransferase
MDHAVLEDVQEGELQILESFSWLLWQHAYEPQLLAEVESRLLWERSYSLAALKKAISEGERLQWIRLGEARAGFVSLRWASDPKVVRLSKLYLHPNYWGQGLGASTLDAVKATARESGATRLELYVFRKNDRAVKAYERAGFRIERAEFCDLGGGVAYDDYLMILNL